MTKLVFLVLCLPRLMLCLGAVRRWRGDESLRSHHEPNSAPHLEREQNRTKQSEMQSALQAAVKRPFPESILSPLCIFLCGAREFPFAPPLRILSVMKRPMQILLAALSASLMHAQPQFETADVSGLRWWKGNTHTHTTNSDGDTSPDTVSTWYREHGYNFLVLSDHNFFTDPSQYRYLEDSSFILISGEELTSSFRSKPVHVNGLNIPHILRPQKDITFLGTIQMNIDTIRNVRGVPHVNHPNFRWAFDHRILLYVQDYRLLEIFNGHPQVHNLGGGDRYSLEQIWDTLLTKGKRIYGIAVDDAHHFKGEFARSRSNPGRGWICIRARRLDPQELMQNLEEGLFYASTSVTLDDVVVRARSIEVVVRQEGDFRYKIAFIGDGGTVLQTSHGTRATFTLRPGLTYVRARVTDSGGGQAWVQPVFVKRQ
ncbi:MAG: hypothetical protein A3C56_09810 [Ignavibacteria bacterium RIFCSPHIGHO2_02_FULL_56_12]|nr:MAG: hypothetical protein A3C56_09810 [Ignavibacteria bacterium RIFCSPHIGHO2_02_FULL_56_12]